jgi:ribonuclease-3
MKYPYREEGFLTEMRSKMVNRQQLNDIGIKMGLKKITIYNKQDNSLRTSQIFGNTLEALIATHMFLEDLEGVDINIKNKLYAWANKNGKVLEFETLQEKFEGGRRQFTIGAMVDGAMIAEGKGFNKKDASHMAARLAVEKLGL